MKTKTISIKTINDLVDFIKHTSAVKKDVTVKQGRYIIDAKSIMGMMSIDTSEPFEIEYPENDIIFDKYVNLFTVV